QQIRAEHGVQRIRFRHLAVVNEDSRQIEVLELPPRDPGRVTVVVDLKPPDRVCWQRGNSFQERNEGAVSVDLPGKHDPNVRPRTLAEVQGGVPQAGDRLSIELEVLTVWRVVQHADRGRAAFSDE